MQKVKLITDSACDLPKEILKELNIGLMPFSIIFNGKEYKDYIDLDQKKFLQKLNEYGSIPTTALLTRDEIYNTFKQAIEEYESVIYVSISSRSSGTYNVANLVKKEMDEEYGKELDITVIDSMGFSLMAGRAVYEAAQMAQQGKSRDEIISHIRYILDNTDVRFIVNDLKYLKTGGRIRSAEAIIAGVLGINPILTVEDGLVVPIAKERGMKKALQKVINDIKKDIPSLKTDSFYLVHCDNMPNLNLLEEKLKENFTFNHIYKYETYATISTHAGPGVCAVIYLKEQK